MVSARCYDCPACGGLVREASRVCGYCGTPIATVRCGLCFSMNVAEAHNCMMCGAELGLEPVTVETASSSLCPRCPGHTLDAFTNGDGPIFDCGNCGGQFVAHDVLRVLVNRHENGPFHGEHRYVPANPFHDPVKYLRCPFCSEFMQRRNFGKVSGIVVDVCAKHGTWFDIGELARILFFVSDGGMKRAAEFEQDERARARRSSVDQLPQPTLTLNPSSSPLTWSDMRDAARGFADWIKSRLD